MAMGKERSKALHNFTMPLGLRWGNQRFLRCMKVNSDGEASHLRRLSGGSDHHHRHPIQQRRTTREGERDSPLEFLRESHKVGPTPSRARRRFSGGDDSDGADADDGIAATREKVMLDLQTAADKIKNAIFKDGLEEGEVSAPPPPPPPPPPPRQPSADAEAEAHCPWNLRTRRASSRAASGFTSARNGGSPTAAATGANDVGGGKTLRFDAPRPNSGSSQMRAAALGAPQKLSIYGNDGSDAAATSGEKRERVKFSVPLSKKEIEEDFYAMVGHRPPRRPKKRARNVQKQLDTLFPGLSLGDITAEKYKVNEGAP